MNWTEILKTVGIASATLSVVAALIAYLIKSVFKSLLDKDFETFKTQLQFSVSEHQIQFATLHADRATVIKDIYAKLVETEKSMKTFISEHSEDLQSEKRKLALTEVGGP